MDKIKDERVKEILNQYLFEPPSVPEWQKRQLNQGGEVKKDFKVNGYKVEIRITFQGWQVKVFKGTALCAECVREKPLR